MKRIALAFLLCAAAIPALACIQSYATNLQGERIVVNGLAIWDFDVVQAFAGRDATFWRDEQQKILAKPQTIETRNDYAVTLIHLGDVAQAMKILQELEHEKPGLYATAANIGTAHELLGENAEALRWIRESIRRNAQAHEGTEWVHVAVLEAKLAQAKDPHWLDAHSILGSDFGANGKPRMPAHFPGGNDGTPVTADAFRAAVFYQLTERLQFVKPLDPYVADLLFDWGNILALTESAEAARELYKQSLRFGPKREPLVQKRIAHMTALIRKAQKS